MTLHRRDFITGVAGATGVLAITSLRVAAQTTGAPRLMYVGSFTSPERGHGEGIGVYARQAAKWNRIQLVKDLENPSYLILDRTKTFLYCVHSDGDRVSAYRVGENGQLSLVGHQATGGSNGVHLSIDATDKFLVLANYASGTVAVLPINSDGSLAQRTDLAALPGTPGPHKVEQTGSHPHHCPFDPGKKFVVVPDKGLDRIFVFRFDASRGRLIPADVPSIAARPGAGPRHVGFHPTAPFAYVINELDSTMTTYRFDGAAGGLKPIQRVSTVPESFTDYNTGAEVAVSRSGRFVYGSNRGHDSIVTFSVDPAKGTLRAIDWQPTQGGMPRYFGLDPTEDFMYVANQMGDNVVVFHVNKVTGRLTATGEIIKFGAPCTIAFK
jgi:6-phosphogluconolactonase (cycloisomerase 2 family)